MVEKQRARSLGSNFTTFKYDGKSIAYLEMVADSGQRVLAPHQFVHPLGYRYPTEIVVCRAVDGGTLQLNIRELWHEEVWQQMSGLANSHDITEVFDALSRQVNYVQCTKIITPPDGKKYGKTYHQCTIVDIPDGEQFDISTLSVPKTVTVAYTYSQAF